MIIPETELERQIIQLIINNDGHIELVKLIELLKDNCDWKEQLISIIKRKEIQVKISNDIILSYVIKGKKGWFNIP